jgi:outer membrane protein TolC
MTHRLRVLIAAAAAVAWPDAGSAQQARALSLDEALRLADSQSEAVKIAQAGVLRARGQQYQARSGYFPQVNLSVAYLRTLASQFEALAEEGPTPPPGTPPVPPDDGTTYYQPCTRYIAPAGATDAQRVAALETYARCASGGGLGIDFSRVGFGAANQYNGGLEGSWNAYTFGRVQAQNRAANAGRDAAELELVSQRAKLMLDVTEAYFDAVLAERLVAIAESSLVQSEGVLSQTRLARQVGNQSEFELLRAQVTRDNQMPVLIQRRTERDLAHLRLKQMLNLPFAEPLDLTTQLADADQLMAVTRRAGLSGATSAAEADTAVDQRAAVRQVGDALRAQEAQLYVARADRLPTLSVSSQYGRVAFPRGGLPSVNNFLTNWTVTVMVSVPLFTAGRLTGNRMVAEANVREAEARFEQTRELAALDAQRALAELTQAEAALAASAGTAEQAARAYTIADVRFREGLSTQIELNDSRLLLQQARANQALAVRNLQVTRMRIALLRDLPLGSGGLVPASSVVPATTGGGAQPVTPQTIMPRTSAATSGTGRGGPGGGR